MADYEQLCKSELGWSVAEILFYKQHLRETPNTRNGTLGAEHRPRIPYCRFKRWAS